MPTGGGGKLNMSTSGSQASTEKLANTFSFVALPTEVPRRCLSCLSAAAAAAVHIASNRARVNPDIEDFCCHLSIK
jgi:hypothetical protein